MAVSAVKKDAAKPAAEAEAAAPPPPKKSKAKWLVPLVALIVIGAGGGGYWHFTRDNTEVEAKASAEPVKPPQFLPLEPFTVNLLLEDNPQFLQVGLTMKVSDNTAVELLKQFMPEIRDRILLMLSNQKASVLLTLEGKQKLTGDIISAVNTIITPVVAKPAPKTKRAAAKDAENAEEEGAAAADNAEEEEDETPAKGKKKKPAAKVAAPAPPVLNVLFTSFIIQ
jgi:flagellar protein FliL